MAFFVKIRPISGIFWYNQCKGRGGAVGSHTFFGSLRACSSFSRWLSPSLSPGALFLLGVWWYSFAEAVGEALLRAVQCQMQPEP